MSRSRSTAFLDMFVQVESHLRRLANGRRGESFGAILTTLARTHPVIRRHADDLREYADLRNAIVHERRGDEPIAEPHQETVESLQRIAKIILDPPRVAKLGTMEVVTCRPDTPIGEAARLMLNGEFSQLPVYQEREFVGLLTSETIARWLGAELEQNGGILEDKPVSEVLPYRDTSSTQELISPQKGIIEVIDLFEETVKSGNDLDAVIVTQNGKTREKPIYILTAFDLPLLYRIGSGQNAA